MPDSSDQKRRIAIIGSGFSGLCLAIQLKKAGIESFTIFEKSDRLGGTWRDNTYPGAACDVPAFSYCYSFEQKTDWSRKWSPQAEIRDYMEHCARKYDIVRHIRFGTEIAGARFDEREGVWHLRTATDEEITAEVLVSAVGQLNRPLIPNLPGSTASAASGSTPPAGGTTPISRASGGGDRQRGERDPVHSTDRARGRAPLHLSAERQLDAAARRPRVQRTGEVVLRARPAAGAALPLAAMASARAALPALPRKPVPRVDGSATCREEPPRPRSRSPLARSPPARLPDRGKRILISDDYYQTFARENVELVTSGIDHLTEDAIVTRDGVAQPVDVVILATGFQSTAFLAPMAIEGLNGLSLADEWADGARAYRGMTIPGSRTSS